MGPAPITISRFGSSVRLKTFAFVRYGISLSPQIGGKAGLAPVAITHFENFNICPPTRTVSLPLLNED